MLRSMESLRNFTLGATDGEIGKVKDFYFDDQTWHLRYLVVETGNWLFGKKVLISPAALHQPDWDSGSFPVNLTKDQVKHSPDVDTDKPVSKQQEALDSYYAWPTADVGGMGYMTTGMIGGVISPGLSLEDRIRAEATQSSDNTYADKHLRSFRNVNGYTVTSSEGEIAEVEDFLIDDTNWTITSMVILAGTWYEGKRMIIPVNEISGIDYDNSTVRISQTTENLKTNSQYNYNWSSER